MALSTTAVDINRGTSGVVLPLQLSRDVWAKALEESAIMRLANRVELPGSGITVPVITGDAAADWVDETAEKPVSEATLGDKKMTPHKLAVIELFSNEFRRDMPRVYNELERRLPNSLGKKFDETVFGGVAPGSNFDVLTNSTAINIQSTANSMTVYKNLVAALKAISDQDAELTGWALSPKADAILLNETDTAGRPIFIPNPTDTRYIGSLLGSPIVRTRRAYKQGVANDVLGFAGDWTKAHWGMVEDITIKISDQATVNDGTKQVNLWQRNMFAILVEVELGFVVEDANAFVKLTGTATGTTA